MKAPNLRRRPPFVRGIPLSWKILALKAETPMNLQIEKPPRSLAPSMYQRKSGESRPTSNHLPSANIVIVTEVRSRQPYLWCKSWMGRFSCRSVGQLWADGTRSGKEEMRRRSKLTQHVDLLWPYAEGENRIVAERERRASKSLAAGEPG